jgi:hypothetical protein
MIGLAAMARCRLRKGELQRIKSSTRGVLGIPGMGSRATVVEGQEIEEMFRFFLLTFLLENFARGGEGRGRGE